jgi:hypothetical protein
LTTRGVIKVKNSNIVGFTQIKRVPIYLNSDETVITRRQAIREGWQSGVLHTFVDKSSASAV